MTVFFILEIVFFFLGGGDDSTEDRPRDRLLGGPGDIFLGVLERDLDLFGEDDRFLGERDLFFLVGDALEDLDRLFGEGVFELVVVVDLSSSLFDVVSWATCFGCVKLWVDTL